MLIQSSNPTSNSSMDIVIHPPDSTDAAFAPNTFPYDRLMESWSVVASTLPLWKNRKNVSISYSPIDGAAPKDSFLDTIEFNNIDSPPGKERTRVVGVDKNEMVAGESAPDTKDVKHDNGARYQWRGKGALKVASSNWQVLGYFLSEDPSRKDEDWFTPAGVDIYVRSPKVFSQDKIRAIIEVCKENKDETVRKVSQDFFEIPHD